MRFRVYNAYLFTQPEFDVKWLQYVIWYSIHCGLIRKYLEKQISFLCEFSVT